MLTVIIPCGKAKLKTKAPAGKMYTGGYHRMCQKVARHLALPDRIFILSAKYGFLSLSEVIEPYELTLGQPGCIQTSALVDQAKRKIGTVDKVMALGGKRYVSAVKAIWPQTQSPFSAAGGLGKQMKAMRLYVHNTQAV